jgi:hypothetical protein
VTEDSDEERSFPPLHFRSAGGSRLAHWPPPKRGQESKPVIVKHEPGEPVKRAKPRGWRLTRAIFSEFADDSE